MAHRILKKNSKYLDRENQWWNHKDWKQTLDKSEDLSSQSELKPFVLKMVDRQGYSCSLCNWTEKCSGCVIEPNETIPIFDWLKKCHIAIEWHSQMIEEDYDPTSNEMTRHRSTEEVETEVEEQIISLDKCLQMFHDTEKLTDPSFCGGCKAHMEH